MTSPRSPAPFAAAATNRAPVLALAPATAVTGAPDCPRGECTWVWDHQRAAMRLKFVSRACPAHSQLPREGTPP
jgi:hypothetical protein